MERCMIYMELLLIFLNSLCRSNFRRLSPQQFRATTRKHERAGSRSGKFNGNGLLQSSCGLLGGCELPGASLQRDNVFKSWNAALFIWKDYDSSRGSSPHKSDCRDCNGQKTSCKKPVQTTRRVMLCCSTQKGGDEASGQ